MVMRSRLAYLYRSRWWIVCRLMMHGLEDMFVSNVWLKFPLFPSLLKPQVSSVHLRLIPAARPTRQNIRLLSSPRLTLLDLFCAFQISCSIPRHIPSKPMFSVLPRRASPDTTHTIHLVCVLLFLCRLGNIVCTLPLLLLCARY